MSDTVCHIQIKGRSLCRCGGLTLRYEIDPPTAAYICQYNTIEEAADAVLALRDAGVTGLSIVEGACEQQYEDEEAEHYADEV